MRPQSQNTSVSTLAAGEPRRRAWTSWLARWLPGGRGRLNAALTPLVPVARFQQITIGREAGAGGGTLARMVGTRLNWRVYDHELLEAIAQRMEVPVEEARTFDELAPSVIQDWLLPLGEEHFAPHEAY